MNNTYTRNTRRNNDITNLISSNLQARNNYRNRNRNIFFRNNRVYIDNIPYIIDSIERYPNATDQNITNFESLRNFFEPIEVYPTQSQIENATRIVRYNDILRPLNTSCPISLERFNDNDRVTIIRYCGHIFKTDEINNWFRTNCRCPVCR
jgi:hypothetical protein